MIRTPWLRVGAAAALGAIGACGLAPLEMWFLTVLALVALPAVFLSCASWKQAAWVGWAFGVGWFGHGLIWIVEPFLVDVARHGWMAPFALILMAGGLALFWGAAFGAAWRLGRNPVWRIALLVVFWGLAEFARAYVFTGFPWAGLAQAWLMPTQLRVLGPHGAGLAVLLWTLPVGSVIAHARSTADRRTGRVARNVAIAIAPALVFSALAVALTPVFSRPSPTDRVVRLVQPNAPQHLKWHPDHMAVFFQRSLDFTAAEPKPDLIVWPESSVPVFLHQAEDAFVRIAAAADGVPVIVGIQRYDGTGVYNSLVVIDASGQVSGIYDKHHLVPFGEYMPLSWLAARFGLFGLAAGQGFGYSAGPGAQVMQVDGIGSFLPLICYEAVFPQDVTAAPSRPDLLVQITNDAWFGTRTGPYQHLTQARMRAIEQGVPMIRAANTGISAVIDPGGHILGSIPLGEAGFLDVPLPAARLATPYSRTGDRPVFLLLLVAGIFGIAAQSLGKGKKGH